MLYPLELRPHNNLRCSDLRLSVKLYAIRITLLLLGNDLRSLRKGLLVFYQAIYGQIAVSVGPVFLLMPFGSHLTVDTLPPEVLPAVTLALLDCALLSTRFVYS